MSSRANSTPASGALKMAAIPAAVPAARNTLTWRRSSRSNRPCCSPRVAPTYAIGPSGPAEPPDPRVMSEVTKQTTPSFTRSAVFRMDDSMMAGTYSFTRARPATRNNTMRAEPATGMKANR